MLLSLSKLKDNPQWLIVLSACVGFIFHTHLSLVPLIPVAVFWLIKRKSKFSRRVMFLSFFVLLSIITPLLAFDYFHKGSNITTPLRFNEITADYRNKINPSHHMQALFETLGRVWFIAPFGNNSDELITSCASSSRIGNPNTNNISRRFNPPIFLSLFGVIVLLAFLFNKSTWKKDSTTLLALFILSIIVSFLLFPGGAFEYYLLGIFPLLVFLPGILSDYFPKYKNLFILSVFLTSIVGAITVITNNPEFGLGVKKTLINQVISEIDNQPFELKQTGICHFYEGWRYLFILNDKMPERSDSDTGLGWLYSQEITQNPVKYTVIMSESRVPVNFDLKDAKIIKEGGFSAYVFTK